MPAAHSRPPPLFCKQTWPMLPRPPGIGPTAAKSLAASHFQKPEASARNTCRLASRNGPYGNAKRPSCRPIQQTREPSHSRAATMQALPSPVPLPPRIGTGPAIPTKSDMAENARRNKTGPATALQPTNFHARHNSHGRHTLPMPRDWYGKKPPHCGKQPLVAWQKRLHNGKKRFARV